MQIPSWLEHRQKGYAVAIFYGWKLAPFNLEPTTLRQVFVGALWGLSVTFYFREWRPLCRACTMQHILPLTIEDSECWVTGPFMTGCPECGGEPHRSKWRNDDE